MRVRLLDIVLHRASLDHVLSAFSDVLRRMLADEQPLDPRSAQHSVRFQSVAFAVAPTGGFAEGQFANSVECTLLLLWAKGFTRDTPDIATSASVFICSPVSFAVRFSLQP